MWEARQRGLPEGSFRRLGAPWHEPSLLTLGSMQGKKNTLTRAVCGGPRVQRMGTGFLTVVPGQQQPPCLGAGWKGRLSGPSAVSLKQNLIFNQPMTSRHSRFGGPGTKRKRSTHPRRWCEWRTRPQRKSVVVTMSRP